jgi:5-methylcytosine-specific restriction endonuclease McrA
VSERRKGLCVTCGAQTWLFDVTICKLCYSAKLRARTGSANPEWNRFTSTVPHQDRAARRKPLGKCERCGKPAIDRHHKDDNPLNNALENIEALCRRCHMVADGRLERFRAQAIGKVL